jgi:hypothetical protein
MPAPIKAKVELDDAAQDLGRLAEPPWRLTP